MEEEVKRIPQDVIEHFIHGDDPQERIVNMDYKYQDSFITVYYRDENDIKHSEKLREAVKSERTRNEKQR